MAWVRFVADFDFKPHPQTTVAYRAGDERNVTRACTAAAVANGAAERIKAKSGKRAGDADEGGSART